jgi:hypothetical protein
MVMVRTRLEGCQSVPVIADERLPNADLAAPAGAKLPTGWSSFANGVELHGPAIDGKGFALTNGRALQLIGINNYVQTPDIAVSGGKSYCFTGQALTDSDKNSTTRVRAVFRWLDAQGNLLSENISTWQKVVLWQPKLTSWAPIEAQFRAPDDAATLQVRIQPASDDRVYLDDMHVRWTATEVSDDPIAAGYQAPTTPPVDVRQPADAAVVIVQPWPNGRLAALSFSFDWETTMGGPIHTRTGLDDPNSAQDPITRGLRMRQGVTTTLDLFRPYGIQATYYATGYNFLPGNTEQQLFMGNPTFTWATPAHGWPSDWSQRPWFSTDPYGTIQTNPEYYFGDLVPRLQAEKQAVESHTFSHLYGGYALPNQWRDDFVAWNTAADADGVPPARSLAFPWSSSAGMSDASWKALEDAGITSITRTNWSQPQYQLADREHWQCKPVTGHEVILACPDFYLLSGRTVDANNKMVQAHAGGDAAQAVAEIDRAIAAGGMIDIWSHTEEVTTPEQIADWRAVITHAAQQRDAGKLWIAPMTKIADWQQALGKLRVMGDELKGNENSSPLQFTVKNESERDLSGVVLTLPFPVKQYKIGSQELKTQNSKLKTLTLDVPAGQSLEVTAWPA